MIIEKLFQKMPKLRRLYIIFLKNAIFRFTKNKGHAIINNDWDYLIILDACRFDTFKKYNTIPGKLSKKISKGSFTREWAKNNFKTKQKNTVYISANPQISNYKYKEDNFCGQDFFLKLENVWDYGWDKEKKTVLPKTVTNSAIKLLKKYPNKRMIIHYIQPHQPHIVTNAKSTGWEKPGSKSKVNDVMELAAIGKINKTDAIRGYILNLKIVLEEIKILINNLSGKVVITSDHGECFGEHFIWGHPEGLRFKELLDVPWLEINIKKSSKQVLYKTIDKIKI